MLSIRVALPLILLLLAACRGLGPAESLERRAQEIDRALICPICPSETIDQSQVELAKQMRALVREMLAQGKSRGEILDFFSQSYGPGVLAAPPTEGFTLLVWLVPPLALAGGGLALWLALQGMRRAAAEKPRPAPGAAAPELDRYLRQVDQELQGDRAIPALPPEEREQASGERGQARDG